MNTNIENTNIDIDNANVCQLFADIAKGNQRPALIMPGEDSGGEISFSELWKLACVMSNNLKQSGLLSGDRVIIMVPMSIDLYVTLLAVVKTGAIAVFVDPWIPSKKMAAFASFAKPKAFIGIGKSHWLRFMEPSLRKISLTITTGRCFAGFPAQFKLKNAMEGTPDWNIQPVNLDDSALITFTSGSSGEPKGANRTHRFLMAQQFALTHEFPYTSADIDMPMFPIFALNNLVSGITSVIPDMDFQKVAEVDGNKITRQMGKNSVTTCTASPPFFDRLCDEVESSGRRPALRRLLTGGAPVSNRQLERWNHVLPESEIIVAYGSTEAEPVGHISATNRLALKLQPGEGYCTGSMSKLVNAKVIRVCQSFAEVEGKTVEDLEIAIGQIGELVVNGEHVCRDYYNNPQATAENKLRDRQGNIWHRMGDTGRIDEQGRFMLAGRVHSTIMRDGLAIHPQLVEQQIASSIGAVKQVAALGVPDPVMGQACWVCVHVDKLSIQVQTQIQTLLELNNVSCDKVVQLTEPMPVDPRHNSKIDYDALRNQVVEGAKTRG